MSDIQQVFPKRIALCVLVLYALHRAQLGRDQKQGGGTSLVENVDDDDVRYAHEETKRRKDRLEQLIARECEMVEDVTSLLEALEEYISAQSFVDGNRNKVWGSECVKRGYLLVGRGIATILKKDDTSQMGDSSIGQVLEGPVKQLREHLTMCPDTRFAASVEKEFEEAASHAVRSIRKRRTEQAAKAWVILRRALPEAPMIAISSILSIYAGTLESARLYLRGEVLTRAIALATGDKSRAKSQISFRNLFLLEVLAAVVSILKERAQTIGKRRFIQNLKTDLFAALVSQDMVYFEKNDLWEVRHLIGNSDYVCTSLLSAPTTTLEAFSRVASALFLLFKQSSTLSAFIFLLALPLKSLLNHWLDEFSARWERIRASLFLPERSFLDIWATLVEPRALKTMRAFAREPKEIEEFSRSVRAKDAQDENSALVYQLVNPARDALDKLLEVFGAWYGGKLVGMNQMRAADLPAFVSLCSDTFDKGRFLYASLGAFGVDVLEPVERMHDLLVSKPRVGLYIPPYNSLPDLEFSIEFENVRFAYPTRPQAEILRGVSFKIRQGEHVGVMGESGCGKSTLFALIERFYEPTSGSILIGGHPIEKVNPLFLRERIAYVSQASYMAKRTIKENLLYGRRRRRDLSRDRDDEAEMIEIKKALELAQCSFFMTDLARFPDGLLTDIGQNASKLSGGEVQRLALARALLCEPPPRLLLLDEYTSALDETSQKKVQEAIEAIWERSGRTLTILSIAHRISNFKNVNKVIAMSKEGKIAEMGAPKDLLRDYPEGIFATFVKTSEVDFTN